MLFKRKRIERTQRVGAARCGDLVSVASVQTVAAERPVLTRLLTRTALSVTDVILLLQREWKRGLPASTLVLDRGQYHLAAMEAPDVPREEWAEALRWQLGDLVDFPVDDAIVQVLVVPEVTQLRASHASIVLLTSQATATALDVASADEGHGWASVEVPETALRNLCALGETDDKAHALMAFGETCSMLVITFRGELLMARTIEVGLSVEQQEEAQRSAALGRAGLEMLRTLDTFERIHSQVQLNHVSVALPPGFGNAMEVLRDLVYQPMKLLDLSELIDLEGLGEQGQRLAEAPHFHELCAIGGALRLWSEQRQVAQVSLQPAAASAMQRSWSLDQGARWAGLLLGGAMLSGAGLSAWAMHLERRAQQLSETLAALSGKVPTGVPRPRILVEMEDLRATEKNQQAVRDALARMSGEAVGNYSDYLKALSRQAPGQLWITKLQVQPNGMDLQLAGTMTDPRLLPRYIAQLGKEPLFRGRRFAQVEMSAATLKDGGMDTGLTDFSLKAEADKDEPRQGAQDGMARRGGS